MKHILIIGAGPAGMLAAITAAERGAEVTVLERNPYAGKKLGITGKGRCNVTNNCSAREVIEATTGNPKFLFGAVNRFGGRISRGPMFGTSISSAPCPAATVS